MSTFTASATTLAWRRDATSWNTEGAMQGRYGDQTDRTGVMQFPTVRSVDWPNQTVSKIELKMVFDKVGTSAAKTISLYRGAKNAISGTGAQMRGAAIGSFSTGGTAYSSTRTVAFSESVNAGAFANLVDWLKNGSTNTLVMYRSEAVGVPNWSPNYLRVTSATLSVTYEIAGSGGQLDKDEVFAGETLALSISPLSETAAHEVVWSFGEHVQTQSLDAGETEAAFTVPMDWLDAIPDSASGAAVCTLTTFEDGVQKGARTMGFTVRAPQSAAPSFTAAIAADSERVDTEDFYQYLTRAVVRAENASAQHGAAIASYSIYGGENSSSAEDTLTTDYFQLSGAHSYILRVTDTRGLTSEQMVSCEVAAVAQPEVTAFSVERYTTTDEGQFLRSDYGENVWVTVQAAWDELGGLNPAEATILYGPAGSGERTRVNLPAAGGGLSLERDRTVIPEEIGAGAAWVFELVFADRANVTGASDSVAKGRCNVHFAGSGYGAAFGGFAQGTEESPLLESYYPRGFTAMWPWTAGCRAAGSTSWLRIRRASTAARWRRMAGRRWTRSPRRRTDCT